MAKEESKGECCPPRKWQQNYHNHGNTCGVFYFFGMIGVAVYYIQQISGFWPIVLAILKAIVWPAFLVYKVFSYLNI
jgi:hypothetical protein